MTVVDSVPVEEKPDAELDEAADAMARALWDAYKTAPWDSGLCPEDLKDEMRNDARIMLAALRAAGWTKQPDHDARVAEQIYDAGYRAGRLGLDPEPAGGVSRDSQNDPQPLVIGGPPNSEAHYPPLSDEENDWMNAPGGLPVGVPDEPPKHQVRFTIEGDWTQATIRCPFDPADPNRPCRPWLTEDESGGLDMESLECWPKQWLGEVDLADNEWIGNYSTPWVDIDCGWDEGLVITFPDSPDVAVGVPETTEPEENDA